MIAKISVRVLSAVVAQPAAEMRLDLRNKQFDEQRSRYEKGAYRQKSQPKLKACSERVCELAGARNLGRTTLAKPRCRKRSPLVCVRCAPA